MSHIVSKREAAEFFDISVQGLDHWFLSGCPVLERAESGAIKSLSLKDMARWWHDRDSRKAEDDAVVSARDSGEIEKALLTRQQRIAQEMKNEQARRELAPVSLISWTLSKVGSQIAAILESIPLKIKTVAPRLSAVEIEQVKREVVKAQNAASNVDVDLDEYYGTNPAGNLSRDSVRVENASAA